MEKTYTGLSDQDCRTIKKSQNLIRRYGATSIIVEQVSNTNTVIIESDSADDLQNVEEIIQKELGITLTA